MIKQKDLGNIPSLWEEYGRAKSIEDRNKLIEKYRYLVKFISERIKGKFPYFVELDDLISAGTFGLIDAIEGFELSRGVK